MASSWGPGPHSLILKGLQAWGGPFQLRLLGKSPARLLIGCYPWTLPSDKNGEQKSLTGSLTGGGPALPRLPALPSRLLPPHSPLFWASVSLTAWLCVYGRAPLLRESLQPLLPLGVRHPPGLGAGVGCVRACALAGVRALLPDHSPSPGRISALLCASTFSSLKCEYSCS